MKKTYIIPSVEIVNVSANTMICTSNGGGLDPKNGSGTVSTEFVTSGTASESRGFDWDDEE